MRSTCRGLNRPRSPCRCHIAGRKGPQAAPRHAPQELTDASFDAAAAKLLASVASSSALLLATHNRDSLTSAVREMDRLGLPRNHERVHFAQILGMARGLRGAKVEVFKGFEWFFNGFLLIFQYFSLIFSFISLVLTGCSMVFKGISKVFQWF